MMRQARLHAREERFHSLTFHVPPSLQCALRNSYQIPTLVPHKQQSDK